MDKRLYHLLYFYAIQKRDEGCKKLIYHYTSVDSFFHTLNSMSLKVSDFAKSDNLNEANVANVDRISDVSTVNSLEKFIKTKYLSFVHDTSAVYEIDRRLRRWKRYKKYLDDWCKDDT